MRLTLASFVCAALVAAASAAAAQPTLPSKAELAAMSPAEFRAFLAGPALNKDNVLRATHADAHAARGPSCPEVQNEGFNTSSAAVGPFAQMALLLSSIFRPH